MSAMRETDPDPAGGASPLEALLELPRSAREDDLEEFLVTVADTVSRTAGFETVVLNLYRAAWDDYEAALVVGARENVDALLGTTTPRSAFRRILAAAPQPVPGVVFLAESSDLWDDLEDTFTPQRAPSEDPEAWRAGDGVIAFLTDSTGAPLGVVSMDEPVSGRRPGEDDLRLISAICAHAESALQSARRVEQAGETTRVLSRLLQASPALSRCATIDELFELAGSVVVPDLGFERFAAYAVDGGNLVLCATRGWSEPVPLPRTLRIADVDALLALAREQAGCLLGAAADLLALGGPDDSDSGSDPGSGSAERSGRNGRGATAWRDHCIVVPCRATEGDLQGLVVVEDPIDRLLPSADRRRALRLLVDHVSAVLVAAEQRRRLGRLATHDPLTGVRNRRGLETAVGGREVSILVCDLDRFTQVNDRHGHRRGDEALADFGALLRELARADDVPMRLGGKRFCVILPRTGGEAAMQAAERLRRATRERLADLLPGGLTVSIGVATTTAGVLDAQVLVAAAEGGLAAAKAAGRDRSEAVDGDLR